MRSFTVFGLPLVVAVSGVAALDNWGDYEWSYRADKTAEWYKAHRQPLPELAPEITIVEPRKSYVVKLDCIACPFRVREYGQLGESWQEPPQDNSLLLNFTVDDSKPGLLLNGHRIAPLDSMPLGISAYQTPANLSKEIMGKMTSMHMLDKSWVVGTKYGSFELQYVHSVVRTKEPGKTWIQFDVTNAYVRHGPAGQATLDKKGQKMVQILLHQEKPCKKATIEAIQVIEKNDRVKPYRMKCGKLAMFQTEFNPLEWDYYGKFGTWSRTWHLYLWQSGEFLESNALVLILAALGTGIFSLVRWHKRQQQAKAADQAREDAETALLEGECEDDYPYYADIPEIKIEEWSD